MKFVKIKDFYINFDNISKFYISEGNNGIYSIRFEYIDRKSEEIIFINYETYEGSDEGAIKLKREFYDAIENLRNVGIGIETEINYYKSFPPNEIKVEVEK